MTENPADAAHRRRTLDTLETGARELGCVLTGEPVWGWGDRSVGTRGTRDGEPVWVRAVGEQVQWVDDDFWTGNHDAGTITGVPKPRVLAWTEMRTTDRWFRVEVMTLVEAAPASPTPELTAAPDVDDTWFSRLDGALGVLADVRTGRVATTQEGVTQRLREYFGDRIDPTVDYWLTAHNDLHWANLTAPDLVLLDWEHWGQAPFGYDAATLYCHSLLVPDAAERVRAHFREVLDAPDGRRSQLLVVTRMLGRTRQGDYLDLVGPLHALADRILGR